MLAGILFMLAKDLQLNQGSSNLKQNSFWRWQNVCAIFVFALIYGIRYNVGVDNIVYITSYENLIKGIQLSSKQFEAGYSLLANIFAKGRLHFSIFIGFWGALQIFFIYYAMRNDKYLLPFIALFIVLGPVFLTWANTMRQAVAECIFIYSIEFIKNKKFWHYCLLVLIASLIHKSAIMLLPFYFIFQKIFIPKNKYVLVIILLICTLIGWTPTFLNLMLRLEDALLFLNYDEYVFNMNGIIEKSDNFRQWGPARAGTWVLYLACVWIYPSASKKLKLDKRFDIYFECFFFGRCLYELFANTSQIFIRPILYFMDFYIIIVPVCLYYLYKQRKRMAFIVMSCLAYFYTIYWTLKAYTAGGLGDKAPEVYKFFFMQ